MNPFILKKYLLLLFLSLIAPLSYAADDSCGPGEHWLDHCSGNITQTYPSQTTLQLAVAGNLASIELRGSTTLYRGQPVVETTLNPVSIPADPPIAQADETIGPITPATPPPFLPHQGVMETEIVSLQLEGLVNFCALLPPGSICVAVMLPVSLRAGDGQGNFINDHQGEHSLYSTGVIYESATDPSQACGMFNLSFELSIGVDSLLADFIPEKLYGVTQIESCFDKFPPLNVAFTQLEDSSLYYSDGKEYGQLVTYIHKLPVEIKELVIKAQHKAVMLRLTTAFEENNSGYQMWRAEPIDERCSSSMDSYRNIQPVGPMFYSQGTAEAVYRLTDTAVTGGKTYCYAVESIDYQGQSTYHLDHMVSITLD